MRLSDVAKLSTRMFKTNPARTWLTILGMGVGTGAVVMLVGLGFGLQAIILEQIVFGETLLSLNVSNPPSGAVILDNKTLNDFLKLEHVKDVSPMASFPALVTYNGLTGNAFVQGMKNSYMRYTGVTAKAGELLQPEDEESGNAIMLSQAVLKLFGVDDPESIVGKSISIRLLIPGQNGNIQEVNLNKNYVVRGISNEAAALTVLMPLQELSKYTTVTKYDRVQVRVNNSDNLTPVQTILIEKGFNVTALSKTVEQATKIFQGIQAVLALFGGIALIVSAIGMFNTMTVTLLERTNEIGIMRTIGASPLDIKILFLSESVVVGFLGGIVGILIGMGIGFGVNIGVNILASKFGGVAMALFKFPFLFLLFIASFSAVVGFMTGVFPARRAASLNPLDAIRYK